MSGCSSCGETGPGNTESANANSVNVITPQRAPSNASPDQTNSNSNLVPYGGQSAADNPTLDQSKVKVIDLSKVKPQPLPARKMPDNSEISTVQSPDGKAFIETRKFNGEKQLLKVERITKSASDKVVKVYLRNGKVFTVGNDKLKDFSKDTASSILQAVGVKPEASRNSAPEANQNPTSKKKPGVN